MAIFSPKTYSYLAKALAPHGPDGILAFAIFAGVLTAAPFLGFLPCAAFGLLVFAAYGVRKALHERHTERMQLGEIRKKQVAVEEFCAKQQVKLRKKEKGSVTALPRSGRSS